MAMRMRSLLMGAMPQLRYEPHRRRVRAFLGDRTVIDSHRVMLVWEPRRVVPVFAVPAGDVHAELIETEPAATDFDQLAPTLGPQNFELHTASGRTLDVVVGSRSLHRAAFAPDAPELAGYVLLDFEAFDRWLEEAEELIGHPHDPYKRIDTMRSDRRVTISFDGEVLAESTRAVALYETHLPVRWYLPPEDVRMDRLEPSSTRTTCAYKGRASYFSLAGAGPAGVDVCWTYSDPLHDGVPVAGMLCFWGEHTDLTLDGGASARPVSRWSSSDDRAATEPAEWEAG